MERPPRPPPPGRPPAPVKATPPSVKRHLEELQDLEPQRVRWFYQEEKKWVSFNGADSLEIERSYKQIHRNVVFEQETFILPTVRGRLYQVDVLSQQCTAMYWREKPVPVLRGTWFKGAPLQEHWEPLDEKAAARIEDAHQNVIRSLGVGSLDIVDSENPVIYQLKIGHGYRVDWHDISEVYLFNESTGSRLAQKIGFGGPSKLHRGYHTEADPCDCPSEINHMVFLIHGIGQLMHYTGGIVNSCKKFREVADKANGKYFKEPLPEGRVEFFPVEWRTSLKLDEGIIDAITPNNIGGLRKLLNESTMDIMYYTSPYFREEIIRSLREQLNSVYRKYCERNPSFAAKNGKVSVIAHSLGSVIFHDILINWNSQLLETHDKQGETHADQGDKDVAIEGRFSWIWGMHKNTTQEPVESSENSEVNRLEKELKKAKLKVSELEANLHASLTQSKLELTLEDQESNQGYDYSLEFKVDSVFNIGSPMGVFLIMKGVRPREDLEQHILPASVCQHYYNIFDPTDPVAYRLEPLIYEHYAEIPPMKIAQLTNHLDDKKKESRKSGDSTSGWIKSWFTGKSAPDETVQYHNHKKEKIELPKSQDEITDEILKESKERRNRPDFARSEWPQRNKRPRRTNSSSDIVDHKEGTKNTREALVCRLDYVLASGYVEYFSVLTAHVSYWTSLDLARFVLSKIYSSQENLNTASCSKI